MRCIVLAALFFSVFTNLLLFTGPLFMLQVYDRVLASRSEETLMALFALVVVLYVLYWLLDLARSQVVARAGARLHSALGAPVFRAILERAALKRGPLAGSPQDLEAMRTLFTSPVLLALLDLPWTPLFLATIFIFHPMLGWLAVAGGGVLVVVGFLNQLVTARGTAEGARLAHSAQCLARASEESGEALWAQGMVDAMERRWTSLQNDAMRQTLRVSDWTGTFTSLSRALRFLLQSAMLALGAWLVLASEITAGAMVAASILLGRALAPVETCLAQWPTVQRARDGWRSLGRLPGAPPTARCAMELPATRAQLELSDVTVIGNRTDAPVLAKITFELSPGEALGVIGRSGSGKTALARVIMGIGAPTAGQVRLAGATVDQLGAERLARYVGYLPQDVRLFEGTIAENIARMETAPDAAKVIAAAQKAGVHEIVLRLPRGYDTRIGAPDVRLSGGQKQRLALARALYAEPQLLILDEPNSALDAEGSGALNAAITAMKSEGKSVVIMTHRPTAIASCDKLMMLDGGRVAAYGPRDAIIRSMMTNASDVQRLVAG